MEHWRSSHMWHVPQLFNNPLHFREQTFPCAEGYQVKFSQSETTLLIAEAIMKPIPENEQTIIDKARILSEQTSQEYDGTKLLVYMLTEGGTFMEGLDEKVLSLTSVIREVVVNQVIVDFVRLGVFIRTFNLDPYEDLNETFDGVDLPYVVENLKLTRNLQVYLATRDLDVNKYKTDEGNLFGAVQRLVRHLPDGRLKEELRRLSKYRFTDGVKVTREALQRIQTFREVLRVSDYLEDDVARWPRFLQFLFKYPVSFIHYAGTACQSNSDMSAIEYLECGMNHSYYVQGLPQDYQQDLRSFRDLLSPSQLALPQKIQRREDTYRQEGGALKYADYGDKASYPSRKTKPTITSRKIKPPSLLGRQSARITSKETKPPSPLGRQMHLSLLGRQSARIISKETKRPYHLQGDKAPITSR
uniref:Uncharacterized protein n=1 Tax=Timema bartmani TaxID=61472 RepID=A0A7R9F6F3_9NEOP|nr:unnamed protein product [Timema bartmani]